MTVRAKFRVTSVEKRASNTPGAHDTDHVKFSAVIGNTNKTWSKWTPSGSLEIQINNPDLLNHFVVGRCYFLDLAEAPENEADER